MKTSPLRLFPVLAFAASLALAGVAPAAETKLEPKPADTIRTVLNRQVGNGVELRLRSGEKIGGKVELVGEKLVHLSQLTGAEFFEAVVSVDDVIAVIARAKAK